jgi:hypothetical protein
MAKEEEKWNRTPQYIIQASNAGETNYDIKRLTGKMIDYFITYGTTPKYTPKEIFYKTYNQPLRILDSEHEWTTFFTDILPSLEQKAHWMMDISYTLHSFRHGEPFDKNIREIVWGYFSGEKDKVIWVGSGIFQIDGKAWHQIERSWYEKHDAKRNPVSDSLWQNTIEPKPEPTRFPMSENYKDYSPLLLAGLWEDSYHDPIVNEDGIEEYREMILHPDYWTYHFTLNHLDPFAPDEPRKDLSSVYRISDLEVTILLTDDRPALGLLNWFRILE